MPKVRKAVIPAAGLGTRLYPASAAIPKAFFPFVDRDGVAKPLIQMVAEEAIDAGIEEICIIVQPGEEAYYRDYFRGMDPALQIRFRGKDWALLESEKLASLGQRLHFAQQTTAEGFGHAVYQARSFVADDPFLLILGDHLFLSATKDRCARQLIAVFEQYDLDALTAVQVTLEQDLHLFGTIRGEPVDAPRGVYKAQLIVEKPSVQLAREQLVTPGLPAGNYLAHFGMHVFSPRIFGTLEYFLSTNQREKGEFQLTTAQERLRQLAPDRYYAAVIQGQRLDAGIPTGLLETQLALALRGVFRTQTCESIARLLATQSRD